MRLCDRAVTVSHHVSYHTQVLNPLHIAHFHYTCFCPRQRGAAQDGTYLIAFADTA